VYTPKQEATFVKRPLRDKKNDWACLFQVEGQGTWGASPYRFHFVPDYAPTLGLEADKPEWAGKRERFFQVLEKIRQTPYYEASVTMDPLRRTAKAAIAMEARTMLLAFHKDRLEAVAYNAERGITRATLERGQDWTPRETRPTRKVFCNYYFYPVEGERPYPQLPLEVWLDPRYLYQALMPRPAGEPVAVTLYVRDGGVMAVSLCYQGLEAIIAAMHVSEDRRRDILRVDEKIAAGEVW